MWLDVAYIHVSMLDVLGLHNLLGADKLMIPFSRTGSIKHLRTEAILIHTATSSGTS